jgi:hypothetical protein
VGCGDWDFVGGSLQRFCSLSSTNFVARAGGRQSPLQAAKDGQAGRRPLASWPPSLLASSVPVGDAYKYEHTSSRAMSSAAPDTRRRGDNQCTCRLPLQLTAIVCSAMPDGLCRGSRNALSTCFDQHRIERHAAVENALAAWQSSKPYAAHRPATRRFGGEDTRRRTPLFRHPHAAGCRQGLTSFFAMWRLAAVPWSLGPLALTTSVVVQPQRGTRP